MTPEKAASVLLAGMTRPCVSCSGSGELLQIGTGMITCPFCMGSCVERFLKGLDPIPYVRPPWRWRVQFTLTDSWYQH